MIISHGSYCPGSEAVFIHHVTKARNKSGDEPGNVPGDEAGNVPGDEPGNGPGDEPGDVPGDEAGNVPGDEPGNEPGDVPGDEPHQPEFCPTCYDSKCWPGNNAKCLSLLIF